MRFHLLTIFPEFLDGPFELGVVGRALKAGVIEIETHDLRNYAFDRHRTVDDRPFGGDEGMVLQVEPIFLALEAIKSRAPGASRRTVLLSAQGAMFDQAAAERLAKFDEVVLICGRYEGVDERVSEHLADEELSVGSFVLSGGEWAAGMVVDSVSRLLPRGAGERSFQPARVVLGRRWGVGLSALHAAGGVSRVEGAGCVAERESRRDSSLASSGGAREDVEESSGAA